MKPLLTGDAGSYTLEDAYLYCERLARTHYENFTVGSILIPRAKRRHVYAIYAYCRWVDDLGDEALPHLSAAASRIGWKAGVETGTVDERKKKLDLLDRWAEELEQCYSGKPGHPVMVALQETVRTFDIPKGPFLKLIETNRMEQRENRYPTYEDLLYYCDHSANPVGHLFLYLFGYRDHGRQRLADYTCTALQLANFWQDVARDYTLGRIYIPLEDMERFGYGADELASGVVNENFRRLMAFEVGRARGLFREGAKLVDSLDGSDGPKLDVALFTAGGLAVLRAVERQGYDVLSRRPSLSRAHKARLFLSVWIRTRLGLRAVSP